MLAAAAGRKHHLLFFPCSLTKYVRRASAYVSEDMNLKSDALCSHSNESVKNRSFFIFIFASDGYPLSTHAGRTTYGRAPQLLLFVNSIRPVISFHWSTREITHTSYDLSVWHGHHSQWLPFYQLTEQRRPSTCVVSFWITYPYNSAAPAIPPPQWPIMYMAARSGEIAPITAMPNVTAGFICAPCCSWDMRKRERERKNWKKNSKMQTHQQRFIRHATDTLWIFGRKINSTVGDDDDDKTSSME